MQSLKILFVAVIALALSVLVTGQDSQAGDSNPQRNFPPKTIEGDSAGICPAEGDLEAVRSEIQQEIQTLLQPTATCGGSTGWTRIFYIDSSNSSQQCPSPLVANTFDGLRVCGRTGTGNTFATCTSVILPVNRSQSYSEVCGRIIGYQYGDTEGFGHYSDLGRVNTIDQYYVDGITLTYGSPGSRQHIWTFATGIAEMHTFYRCPCAADAADDPSLVPPSFVGNDFFCETGHPGTWGGPADRIFYGSDPLWDGAGCAEGNTCCELNSPPYFTKQLPTSTTDNIEMRLCGRLTRSLVGGDTLIQIIELYVK